ncbi:fosfomycin resistance glutathione transferase [Sorangium sp. So ce233]
MVVYADGAMAIGGVNHVTLAVRDLDRAVHFYVQVLGGRRRAQWARGAYLELGTLWLCLELDARAARQVDDAHLAFSVDAQGFASLNEAIRLSGARIWKENRSEGASLYFEDPDGHKLEIHVGDLRTRLASCREAPYDGMEFFDDGESETPAR